MQARILLPSYRPYYIVLLMIGLIPVLPLLQPYHTPPSPGFYSEWGAFTLGLIASTTLLMHSFWEKPLLPRVALYWLGMLAIIVCQGFLFTHSYIAQVLVPALYISWAILLMMLTVWLRTHLGIEKVTNVLAWLLLMGGILQTMIAFIQLLGFYDAFEGLIGIKKGAAVYGNIGQQNHFASQIMLASAAVIYLFSLRYLSWLFTLIIATLFTTVMALSTSRAVLLYGAGIVFLSFFSYRRTKDDVHFRFLVMSIILLVLFFLAQYFLPHLATWLKEVLASLGFSTTEFSSLTTLEKLRYGSSGIDVRISEWHKAWLMFLQAPLLGVGVGHYAWHSFLYQSSSEFSGIAKPELFKHSHNLFMQILAEMGIFGSILLATMLLSWLKRFRKNLLSPSAWFIGSCLIVLFIHSNLEYPLWYAYFLGIAAVLLALGDEQSFNITFSSSLGRAGSGAALLLISLILVNTFQGYRKIEQIRMETDINKSSQMVNTLIKTSNNVILAPYVELTLAPFMASDKNAAKTKLEIATRLMHWNPWPIHVYQGTLFLALNNRPAEALALLNQASMVYPGSIPLYIDMAKKIPEKEIQPLLAEAEKIARERNIPLAPSPAPLAGAP